jgi:hypothetical protein
MGDLLSARVQSSVGRPPTTRQQNLSKPSHGLAPGRRLRRGEGASERRSPRTGVRPLGVLPPHPLGRPRGIQFADFDFGNRGFITVCPPELDQARQAPRRLSSPPRRVPVEQGVNF